jgi:hypothetical protein
MHLIKHIDKKDVLMPTFQVSVGDESNLLDLVYLRVKIDFACCCINRRSEE